MPHLSTHGNCAKGEMDEKAIRAKMHIVDDCRSCEVEFQNEISIAFRKEMLRRVVALIRAGGDVTKYWRAFRTLGFVCVEDMSISHRSIKMAIFAVFALCDYKREKRGRVSDSVSPLSWIFPASVMIVISSLDFFL